MQEIRAEKLRLESIALLAAGMAHNLNNLLTGVIGNASLLLEKPDGAPSAKARRILEEIVASGERAANLTAQLLAYAGKGRFVLAPTDLGELVTAEMARIAERNPGANADRSEDRGRFASGGRGRRSTAAAVEALVMNAVEAIGAREDGAIAIAARVGTGGREGAVFPVGGNHRCGASIACSR